MLSSYYIWNIYTLWIKILDNFLEYMEFFYYSWWWDVKLV